MLRWWRERMAREKLVLLAGAVILLLTTIYLVLEPVVQERERLQTEIPKLQEDLAWMQSHISDINRLRGVVGAATVPVQTLTLAVVEDALREAGLKEQTTDLRPAAGQGVQLVFDQVAFADLMELLSQLQRRIAARVSQARIDRLENMPGMVKANMSLVPTVGK
jgi:type II secretory pathway component PulM